MSARAKFASNGDGPLWLVHFPTIRVSTGRLHP
jgi:hypothetical protein